MKLAKQKIMLFSLFIFSILMFGSNKVNHVKADATIKNSNTKTVVRSASVKTDKVIVTPKKTNDSSASKSKTSVSRGSSGRSDIVSYSYKFLGKPYVWGASGPSSFDCSGFTAYVYSSFGVSLDHYTGSQFGVGQSVSKDNLLPGDLVFFNTYESVSHVGIYIGGGQFIHASSGSGKVTISELSGSYYSSRYAGARRILK
ncbi:C40 family peptidase [Clostridium lundense]|uniref:C40 family peptidase n=1 Tax=Clostridium lundense TaxID=319475 RepID=UPI000485921B|nr:C40 family peptidase [Clostridium lundense]